LNSSSVCEKNREKIDKNAILSLFSLSVRAVSVVCGYSSWVGKRAWVLNLFGTNKQGPFPKPAVSFGKSP
ncbi:MAG: hypothetical protein LBQ88_10905, partial [Treponema sp.]|nr:hypothetical protein [Treponema sp.]